MRLFNRLSDDSRSSDVNQENKVFRGRKSEGTRRADASDSLLSPRKLGMETLEERQLLSVNPIGNAEYQEIRDAYQDLALPSSLSEINVIELTDLNASALQSAVDQAAQTTAPDLILLRTTADDYVLDLEATAIKINIDAEKYGALTIVGRGEQALTIETTDANAFTVLNGNVAFDGMVLYNYTTTQYAADLIVTTPDATATRGAAFFEVNQMTTTDAQTGETTTSYSLDKAMTSEELEQYGLSNATAVSPYRTLTNLDGDYNAVRNTIHATLRSQYDYFGWGYNPSRYMAIDSTQIYDAESPASAGWVGTVANMLSYTGWAQEAGFSTTMTLQDGTVKTFNSVEDAVASYLNQNFIESNAGTNPNNGYVLNAAQIIDYLFSGDDQGIEFLTNTIEGGGFFTDIDFHKVGGYVATSDTMIDDALRALRDGNAVTMEVQTTNSSNGSVVREYVSVWGYYYNDRTIVRAGNNVTNNSADYVGLICSNPKMGSYQRSVTDTNYAVSGGTETRTMTHYTDQASAANDNYDTYHTYLLQRVGNSWRFATAPRTYIDSNGAVQGASNLPEGFQYFGTYRNSEYTTFTSEIVGFSWIQQYSAKLSSVDVVEDKVLSLESMPGNTSNVIYLHFAGADGNGWDGLAHPALDLDGSAGYGVSELKFIEEVWRRVAEDYAPFNVNVTTNADVFNAANKGIRVVIGGYSSSAGGVAHVGSFGAQKEDCYVYSYSLGLSAKNVAEAATHETGHTFGLGHDGYEHNEYYGGNSTWAPIMGVGYSSLLTQWSSGDYVNANNQQDDVAIIASVVGYRNDDFGDTIETAEQLENHYVAIDINNYNATSGTYNAAGIIENRDDYDMFSFVSNGGTYVVDVSGDGADSRFIDGDFDWTTIRHGDVENPVFGGKYYANSYNYTNLNVQVSLLDENGAVVLIGLNGAVMKLGYGEKTVVSSNNYFYVVDQFGKNVYNADGSLKEGYLAIDDSTYTTFSHFVTPILEAGKTYYVSVTGVGQGNDATNGYSDYGSLGQYVLSMHESYENFRLDDVRMDVESLKYSTGVDNELNWQEALVYSGRRLENGQDYLGNTLTFNSSLSGQTLNLRETLMFTESRSLVGKPYSEKRFVLDATTAWDNANDQPGITIDANEKFRAVYVDNTTVEMYGFTITGGVAETTNVIYLYFGGIDGTGWSGELHPAFDLDGDPTSFNDAELDYINEVYLRVAEDYSPYNVTVTTDQSVYEAATNAIRVVIGGTGNNRGGVAIVGSFGTQKQDCYIFPNSLGSAKNVAEAVSHEVGHTMGLRHDGKETVEYYNGTNGWAPIMGAGYYEALTQWSKGEYNGATNVEDDLATIAARLGYKNDDYGDAKNNATALRESYLHTGNFVADGLLERTGDVDLFKFVATNETFVIDVVGSGADYSRSNAEGFAANLGFTNLDLKVELYDAAGNLLYTSNPESSLFAHFEANNLTVGEEYYISVSGTGKGDPATTGYSNYGSVGQYYVTAAAGNLASFVGEERYESNTTKIAIRNGAQNATKEAAVGHGKNGQTNNGGGIYNNYGWLTIGDSVIAGNRALKAGGGIYNAGGEYEDQSQHDGWLYLINTSIIGNMTTQENSIGGGMYNESGGVAVLDNTTVAGNKADYSGGGIQNAGIVHLVNSIVAKNDASYGADVYTQSGKNTVAYYSFIGDESRNANYTAYKNGTNTQQKDDKDKSIIGRSAGSSVSAQVTVYDPEFVSFREYADESWSSDLWKSWNLRIQGNSRAVDLGQSDWLNASLDYSIGQVAAPRYDALGQNRYYFETAHYPFDLAGQPRIGGASVDAGAYEVLENPDLTGFIPTSAGSDVVNDWENSIVVSRAVDDQTGSIAPFLVDEQLYLNLAFINQGVSINTNFETTVYLWKYAPDATKEQMFAASKIDGSEVAFLKISVEFETNGSMPGDVGAKITATNLATGATTTFNYDGSTSYIALANLGVGSIQEVVSGLIAKGEMPAQNEEGYYVFGYQLDSQNNVDEHNEANNVFLTTGYFDVVESPVSLNDSIVVTTTDDVVDAYDGQISLREAVEIYAGSFYYREIALPEGASFESGGVTYKVQNGKFFIDSSTDYKVYPGESFTFVETVQTALTWSATDSEYQDAAGTAVVFANGTKGEFTYNGTAYTDALWDSLNNAWTVDVSGVATSIPASAVASVVITQEPVVVVTYEENVYFRPADITGEKAVAVVEGTTANFKGVDVVMKGGVWTSSASVSYDRDAIQAMGSFFLADGTEVAVVNGVFRRVATNDVAVVLDGATVTLTNGETAVYNSAKDRFTVTTTTEYAINDGDVIEIAGEILKFVAKAYVDAAGYRYYLNDGTVVTLANGYEVTYSGDRDAFVFESQTLARKIDAGSTIVWQGKEYSYKAGVAIVEKVSREANAVVFENALDGKTFELKLGQLTLTKSFTLDCVNPDKNLLDLSIRSDDSRLFLVKEGADVTIKNFKLKDSGFVTLNAEDVGGVILNKGSLTIENVAFSDNEALYGGSIYNVGTLSVVESSFKGDDARNGGSIYNLGSLTVVDSSFEDNAASDGGSIYNADKASLIVKSTTFESDSAENGGSIYNVGTAEFTNVEFIDDSAKLGGAIYNEGSFVGNDLNFARNSVETNGGSIYNVGTAYVASSTFLADSSSPDAAKLGGAIFNAIDANLTVESSTFEKIGATEKGGAIYAEGSTTISGTTFNGNAAAENGGAIYAKGKLTLIGASFVGNKATNGAALYAESVLNVSNSTFFKNVATANGGAIFATGTTSLVNVTLAGNQAADGAGLYNAGTATVDNSILAENKAAGADAKGFDLYTAVGATTTLRGSLLANIAKYGDVEYALDKAYRSLLGVDPLFVDSANGVYSLKATSPAINAGMNALDGGATVDASGNARRVGLTIGGDVYSVDMGAYEHQTAIAPNLAIQTDSVKYWTSAHNYEGATKPEEESYYIYGRDVCFEFDVKNIGDGIDLDNWTYSVKLIGTDKNGNVVYDQTQTGVKYADKFDRFDWLNQADWIIAGDAKNMLANLGVLPSGYYTMTLSIDVDGTGNVYEWGEEDGYVGANDNVFVGAFNVYETPSVVVTTEKDVVDPTDRLISLREAVLYAGDYENISKFTVHDGETFVLENGEILTVRNGMLTRKIDVVYKEGVPSALQDEDAFFFNNRSVFYHSQVNGGYFADADGNTVDVTTGSLTYPDGSTATVALKSDQYVEFVGNRTSELNPNEGDRYSYRVLQIPGQAPVRLTDGATFEYSNVKFTYYDTYVDANGNTLDGAFVFEDGTVQEYQNGGTLQIANLKLGNLSTRDEVVVGQLTLQDGSTLEVFNSVAQLTEYVGTTITFAESMNAKTITIDENLGRILLNKELQIEGEDRGVAVSGGDKVGIFEIAPLGTNKSVSISNLTLKQGRGLKGGAIYNAGNLSVQNVSFVENKVYLEGVPTAGLLTDGLGGAIYNAATGTLAVDGGTFSGNHASEFGGAVFSMGTTTVKGATFRQNNAFTGGAIAAQTGTLTVDSSTFDANAAERGGAIYTLIATTINASSFVSNNATSKVPYEGVGGAVYAAGTSVLTISGVSSFDKNAASGYGGAIYVEETASLAKIVDDFTATNNEAGFDGGALWLKSGGLSIEGNATLTGNKATQNGGAAFLAGNVKITGNANVSNNEASGNYGAFAFDAGATAPTLTVGGDATFSGNVAKTGAVGAFAVDALTVDGSLVAVGVQAGSADGFAMRVAKNVQVGGNVEISQSLGDALYVGGNVKIDGNAKFEKNVANANAALYVVGNLTIGSGATFNDNKTTQNHGAVYVGGNATITGALTAKNNVATQGAGGAIYAGGSLTVKNDATDPANVIAGNVVLSDNVAGTDGGAIYAKSVLIEGTATFEKNHAGTFATTSEEIVSNKTFDDGSRVVETLKTTKAVGFGGAIFVSNGVVRVDGDAQVVGNGSTGGGAIYVKSGSVQFGGSATLSDNLASQLLSLETIDVTTSAEGAVSTTSVNSSRLGDADAGAIYANGDVSVVGNLTATNNKATAGDFGAIYVGKGLTVGGKANLSGNVAGGIGGAIFAGESVAITGALTATNNIAGEEGGAIYSVVGTVVLRNSLLANNVAGTNGGAIYAKNVVLVNATVAGNTATNGGGLYVLGTATIDNSILAGNAANAKTIVGVDVNGDPIETKIGGEGTDIYVVANAVVTPRNSLVQNVENLGPGSLTLINDYRCILGVAPEFVDSANGDYSLKATSPAINAGQNALALSVGDVDLAGNARIVGVAQADGTISRIDMGAYEYQTVIAPNLAFGENSVAFWYVSTGRNETDSTDVARQEYYIFGEDVILDFTFSNIGTGKVIDKFNVVLTVQGVAADGTKVEMKYRYQEGSDYCQWLRVSDWLDQNETNVAGRQNLGTLPVGEYSLTITLDTANEIVELTKEDNVYTTNFKVSEQPSVVVTTDQDVVDPLDGQISLREAVEVYGGPLWYASKTLVADGTEFVGADLTNIVVKNGAATYEQSTATIDGGTQIELSDGTELPYGKNYVSCEAVGNRVYLFTYPDGTTATYVSSASAQPLTLTFADGSTATVKTIPYYEYVAVTGQPIKPAIESVDVVVLGGQTIALNNLTPTSIPYGSLNAVYHENGFVGADGVAFFLADGSQVEIDGFQGTLTNGGVRADDGSYIWLTAGKNVVVNGATATYRGEVFSLPDGSLKAFGESFVCENGTTVASFVVDKTVAGEIELVDGSVVAVADGTKTIATYVGSTVTFADSLDGATITVDETLGPITISRDVKIDASNLENLIVSGGGKTGVFVVLSGTEASMKSFTIQGGSAERGAGLLNQGTTTLTEVAFVGNQAECVEGQLENLTLTKGVGGAIYNSGTLTVENGVFSQNAASYYGGAICSVGTLNINDSIFGANKSDVYGGAIYVQNGTATIDNSNLVANQSTYGAAIALAASVSSANLKISNSLLVKNIATGEKANVYVLRGRGPAGGAIYADGANANVVATNVTVVGNEVKNTTVGAETFVGVGGAIALTNGAKLALANSIVAQNVADGGTDIYGDGDATATVKSSLIGVGDDCGIALTTDLTNRSFVGTVADPMNPALDVNYVPVATSPAINTGTNALAVATDGTALKFDLNGNARIVGVQLADETIFAVDMGAYEYQTVVAPDLTFNADQLGPKYATITIDAPTTEDFVEGFDVEFSYKFGNFGTALTVDSFAYTITVVQVDADGNDIPGTEKVYRKVYGDGSNGFLDRSEWLSPTETVSDNWNLGTLPVGQYRLAIALDVDDSVVELNEENNVYETTFGVREKPSLVVTTEQDVVDKYDGKTSLREAIALISNSGVTTIEQNGVVETIGETITFADSVKGKTISVDTTLGELAINRSTTIEGTDANVVLSGQDATRILRVTGANASVSIFGLTFANGDAAIGGAIYNSAKLTLTEVAFSGNGKALATDGGAIYNETTGTLTLTNASLADNVASENGGALYNAGTAIIDRQADGAQVKFEGNDAKYGGAIYSKGTLTLANIAFVGNEASEQGGAVYNEGGTLDVAIATFDGNSAKYGGALVNYQGTANVSNATFTSNAATVSAGAVDNYGELRLTDVLFEQNVAAVAGGALYNSASLGATGDVYRAFFDKVVFDRNRADKTGGAVYNAGGSSLDALGTISFNANVAPIGGAISNLGNFESNLGVSFLSNQATSGAGGAVYNEGNVAFTNATFEANSATTDGGAVANAAGATFYATNVDVQMNQAGNRGGAFFNQGSLSVSNSVVWKNKAGVGGAIANVRSALLGAAVATTTLRSTTIAANSATNAGGVYNAGRLDAYNAVIADNYAATSPDLYSTGNATLNVSFLGSSEGVNVSPTRKGLAFSGEPGFQVAPIFDATGILTNDVSVNLRPLSTASIVNVGNEAYALNANGTSVLTVDLDGQQRVCNRFDQIDLGAYEYQFEDPSLVVTTEDDVVDPTDGKISLREAIEYVQKYGTQLGSTITFATNVVKINVQTAIVIDVDLVVDATSLGGIVLDASNGEGARRVVEIVQGATVELIALTVSGGNMIKLDGSDDPDYCGGGIYNEGNLTLTDVLVTGNSANYGGGVCNAGTMKIYRSTIANNSGSYYGGGYSFGDLYIENTTISGNFATYQGGGFGVYTSRAQFVDVAAYGNYAEAGGAFFIDVNTNSQNLANSGTTFTNCTIVGNVSATAGAGIWAKRDVAINNSIVYGNTLLSASGNSADLYWLEGGAAKSATFANSIVGQANITATGTKNVDPSFVEFAKPTFTETEINAWRANAKSAFSAWTAWKSYDLDLQIGSPAINAGSNALLPSGLTSDLNGERRIVNNVVDLGAFEEQGNVAPTSITFDVVSPFYSSNAVGTTVATANAVDPNADDTFTYEIVAGSEFAEYFAIGGANNNEIVLKKTIPAGEYVVEVLATDSGFATVEKSFVLTVTSSTRRYDVPTITSVSNIGMRMIDVFWSVDGQTAKEYVVEYRIDGGEWAMTNALTGTHGAIEGAFAEGQIVDVRIKALASVEFDESDWSNVATHVVQRTSEAFNVESISLNNGQSLVLKIDSVVTAHSIWRIVWGDGSENVYDSLSSRLNAAHVYATNGSYTPTLYVDGDDAPFILSNHNVVVESGAALVVGETLTTQTSHVFSAVKAVEVAAAPIAVTNVLSVDAQAAPNGVRWNAFDETVDVVAEMKRDPVVLVAQPTTRRELAAAAFQARQNVFADFDASSAENESSDFEIELQDSFDGAFDETFLNDLFEEN